MFAHQEEALLGGVALLEKVCHWWVNYEVSEGQAGLVHCFFLLPANLDVEFSATSPAPCRPAWHHAMVMVTLHSNRNPKTVSVLSVSTCIWEEMGYWATPWTRDRAHSPSSKQTSTRETALEESNY